MGNQKVQAFTDLLAWQEGHKLVLLIYQHSKGFPKEEIFVLVSQMRRAALSVTSNVAEGFSRRTAKEKVVFYAIALGSLTELESQSIVARDLGYIQRQEFDAVFDQAETARKLIIGLRKSAQSRNT